MVAPGAAGQLFVGMGVAPWVDWGMSPLLFEVDRTSCVVCPTFVGVEIKIVAAGCQILRLKYTKFNFGWGSAPRPAGVAYRTPPDT